jgi:hypothetical protein
MPGRYAASPHRAKGSWAPRIAGAAVVFVVAGGALAVYLGIAHSDSAAIPHPHHHRGLPVKVVSVQTVGLIDFGPLDDGDAWQSPNSTDHAMKLLMKGGTLEFVRVPNSEINTGTPEWTADQTSDGGDIFIYVRTGQCLAGTSSGELRLSHCDLGLAQRWRPVHSVVVLGEPIAQYANVANNGCLTAGAQPGPAMLAACGPSGTREQEIAFWWSA